MRKPFFLILALLLVLGLHNLAFAAPQTFDAEGVFIMGDNDTKTQAKEFALQDAKRLALEQAGTYLQSITQVVNGQVTKDEIISIASGVIKLERVLNENAKLEGNFITLTVKARFVIDSDDLQKKIDNLNQSQKRQEEIRQMADLQSRYDNLLAENNSLKTQLAQATDQKTKEQLLSKTQEVHNQLTATQLFDKGYNFYVAARDYESAIVALSQAIVLDSQFADAYIIRGLVNYDKGLHDSAFADFDRAIAINPQDVRAYFCRGLGYYVKGLYDLAIADCDRMVFLNPQYADAYLLKAEIYDGLNYKHEALELYLIFLQYAPAQHEFIPYAKKRLADLSH